MKIYIHIYVCEGNVTNQYMSARHVRLHQRTAYRLEMTEPSPALRHNSALSLSPARSLFLSLARDLNSPFSLFLFRAPSLCNSPLRVQNVSSSGALAVGVAALAHTLPPPFPPSPCLLQPLLHRQHQNLGTIRSSLRRPL